MALVELHKLKAELAARDQATPDQAAIQAEVGLGLPGTACRLCNQQINDTGACKGQFANLQFELSRVHLVTDALEEAEKKGLDPAATGFLRARAAAGEMAAPESLVAAEEEEGLVLGVNSSRPLTARPDRSGAASKRIPVRYGATVLFNTVDLNGFVRGRGLTDPRLYLDELADPAHTVPVSRKEGLFEILPKLNYKASEELQKIRDLQAKAVSEGREAAEIDAVLELEATVERRNNAIQTKKMYAQPVLFGATVQFKHKLSGHFLTFSKDRADSDPEAMKVWLSATGSSSALCRINVAYRSNLVGEPLLYGSTFTVEGHSVSSFLSVCKTAVSGVASHPYNKDTYEVNASQDTFNFQFTSYVDSVTGSSQPQADAQIQHITGGSTITLQHSHTGAFLTETAPSTLAFVCTNLIGTRAMWDVELCEGSFQGRVVETKDCFLLRNLSSGQVLFSSTDQMQLQTTDRYLEPGCMLSCVNFRGCDGGLWVAGAQLSLRLRECSKWIGLDTTMWTNDEAVQAVCLNDAYSDREAIKVNPVDAHMLQALTEVQNYQRSLDDFLAIFKNSGQMNPITIKRLTDLSHQVAIRDPARAKIVDSDDCCKALVLHAPALKSLFAQMVMSCTESTSNDPFTREGAPRVEFQGMFCELKTITTVVALLRCLLADPVGLSSDENEASAPQDKDDADNARLFAGPDAGDNDQGMQVGMQVPDWIVSKPFLTQDLFDAVTLGFRFLQMVVQGHSDGKRQLEAHRDFIAFMLGTDFGVVNTYGALFTDNDSLLRELCDQDFRLVAEWMRKMHQDGLRGARFIDLLGRLTISNEIPIPVNQNSVLDIYFKENRDMMVPLKHVKGAAQIGMPDGETWVSLSEFRGQTDRILDTPIHKNTPEEKIFRFHYQTMRLFSKLCCGRNRVVTDYLLLNVETFGVKYKDLLHMLADGSLPRVYRAAVGELLITLFIDREPYENIQLLSFIRVWNETAQVSPPLKTQWKKADPYVKFPQHAPTPGFQAVKDVIQELLLGMQSFGMMTNGQNIFYAVVLRIALKLLNFGCYHSSTGEADLEVMSEMLDVVLDVLGTEGETQFDYNDTTKIIFDAKLSVCMVCEFMFDCRVERRMTIVFSAYEEMFARIAPAGDCFIRDLVLTKESFPATELDALEHALFNIPIISKKVASSPNVDILPEFVKILLNITQYDFLPVAARAFSLMYRHYAQRVVMIKNMRQMQIVVMPEISCTIELLGADISEVRRNWKWVTSPTSSNRSESLRTLPIIFKRFVSLCTLGSNAELSDGITLSIGPVEVLKFQQMLANLGAHLQATSYFNLPLLPPKGIPRCDMKTIFLECCGDDNALNTRSEITKCIEKVISLVGLEMTQAQLQTEIDKVADKEFNLVAFHKWYVDVFRKAAVPQLKELWNHIMVFLMAFCKSNATNQNELFELIVAPESKLPWMAHLLDPELQMANLLTVMVEGNTKLLDKIGEGTIHQVLESLAQDDSKKATWLEFLINCVAPSGKIHIENAAVVARAAFGSLPILHLASSQKAAGPDEPHPSGDMALLHALIEPQGDPQLLKQAAERNFTIKYVCRSVDLLAALCSGTSSDNEVKAIGRVTYQDVLSNIISLPQLPSIDQILQSTAILQSSSPAGVSQRFETYEVSSEVYKGVSLIFDRYDMDGSGTINEFTEFQQLTINVLIKLKIPMTDYDFVQSLIAQATEDHPIDYSLDTYCQWFQKTFISKPDNSSMSRFEPDICAPSVEFVDDDPNMVGIAAWQRKYAIKKSYLNLWFAVYVNCDHPLCLTELLSYDNNIFPQADLLDQWQLSEPTTLAEDVLADLALLDECLAKNSQLISIFVKQLIDYLFGAVVPMLNLLLTKRYPKLSWTSVQSAFSNALQSKLLRFHSDKIVPKEHKYSLEELLLALGVEINAIQLTEEDETKEAALVVRRRELFRQSWHPFCVAVAHKLGIVDFERMLGQGVKNMAIVLSKNRAIILSQKMKPAEANREFRAIVCAVYQVLLKAPNLSDDITASLLRVIRGCVYFDEVADPDGSTRSANWDAFQVDHAPVMHPAFLKWTQNKYTDLGAAKVIVNSCSNQDSAIRSAALRFGTTMLLGSNCKFQQCLLDQVQLFDSVDFFRTMNEVLERAVQEVEVLVRVRNSQISDIADTAASILRSSRSSIEDSNIEFPLPCREALLVLSFLTSCMLNQNLCFKKLMSSQPNNDASYHLVEVVGNLVREAAVIVSWRESESKEFLMLISSAIEFIIKAAEGPCVENQLFCTRDGICTTFMKIISLVEYHLEQDKELSTKHKLRLMEMKGQAYRALHSMIDGSTNPAVFEYLADHLDITAFIDDIVDSPQYINLDCEMSTAEEIDILCPEEAAMEAEYLVMEEEQTLAAYALLRKAALKEHSWNENRFREALEAFEDSHPCIVADLKAKVGFVEIARFGTTHTVMFPMPPLCLKLSHNEGFVEHATEYMQDVPREDATEKATALMCKLHDLREEMEHVDGLMENSTTQFLMDYSQMFEHMPFIAASIVVGFASVFFGAKAAPYENYDGVEAIATILTLLHALASSVWCVQQFIVRIPVLVQQKYSIATKNNRAPVEDTHTGPAYTKPLELVPTLSSKSYKDLLVCFCQCPAAWYTVLSAILAWLIFASKYFGSKDAIFYTAFLLFDFFRLPAGKDISTAISVAGGDLFNSFQAAVVLISAFACLSFLWYDSEIIANGGECSTSYQCTTLGFDAGLHGDFAEFGERPMTILQPLWIEDETKQQSRWLLTMLYVLAWEWVLAGIVQGQIVDAYALIRETQSALDQDTSARCLICSLERFICDKPPEDQTGMEQYVAQKIAKDDESWLPINTCMKMEEHQEVDMADDLETKISSIDLALAQMSDQLQEALEL